MIEVFPSATAEPNSFSIYRDGLRLGYCFSSWESAEAELAVWRASFSLFHPVGPPGLQPPWFRNPEEAAECICEGAGEVVRRYMEARA